MLMHFDPEVAAAKLRMSDVAAALAAGSPNLNQTAQVFLAEGLGPARATFFD